MPACFFFSCPTIYDAVRSPGRTSQGVIFGFFFLYIKKDKRSSVWWRWRRRVCVVVRLPSFLWRSLLCCAVLFRAALMVTRSSRFDVIG